MNARAGCLPYNPDLGYRRPSYNWSRAYRQWRRHILAMGTESDLLTKTFKTRGVHDNVHFLFMAINSKKNYDQNLSFSSSPLNVYPMQHTPKYQTLDGYQKFAPAQMEKIARRFADMMQRRRSIRNFLPDPVRRDVIEEVLRAAGTAPSYNACQPWKFVAISDLKIKQEIRAAAEAQEVEFSAHNDRTSPPSLPEKQIVRPQNAFIETAPWLIAVFSKDQTGLAPTGGARSKQRQGYTSESVGLATGLLLTALHSIGLASLVYKATELDFLNEICSRPPGESPFLLIATGHPDPHMQIPDCQAQKSVSEISIFIE